MPSKVLPKKCFIMPKVLNDHKKKSVSFPINLAFHVGGGGTLPKNVRRAGPILWGLRFGFRYLLVVSKLQINAALMDTD